MRHSAAMCQFGLLSASFVIWLCCPSAAAFLNLKPSIVEDLSYFKARYSTSLLANQQPWLKTRFYIHF